MAFKFKLAQCVTVPTDTGIQGRVSGRSEFIGAPNLYQVTWLDALIAVQSKVFGEDELLAINVVASSASAPLPEVDFSQSPSNANRHARGSKRRAKR
jgi:hypothetical protein